MGIKPRPSLSEAGQKCRKSDRRVARSPARRTGGPYSKRKSGAQTRNEGQESIGVNLTRSLWPPFSGLRRLKGLRLALSTLARQLLNRQWVQEASTSISKLAMPIFLNCACVGRARSRSDGKAALCSRSILKLPRLCCRVCQVRDTGSAPPVLRLRIRSSC